eukprot:Nk52_evm1s631 gene=Nk52_evmTU1s631
MVQGCSRLKCNARMFWNILERSTCIETCRESLHFPLLRKAGTSSGDRMTGNDRCKLRAFIVFDQIYKTRLEGCDCFPGADISGIRFPMNEIFSRTRIGLTRIKNFINSETSVSKTRRVGNVPRLSGVVLSVGKFFGIIGTIWTEAAYVKSRVAFHVGGKAETECGA